MKPVSRMLERSEDAAVQDRTQRCALEARNQESEQVGRDTVVEPSARLIDQWQCREARDPLVRRELVVDLRAERVSIGATDRTAMKVTVRQPGAMRQEIPKGDRLAPRRSDRVALPDRAARACARTPARTSRSARRGRTALRRAASTQRRSSPASSSRRCGRSCRVGRAAPGRGCVDRLRRFGRPVPGATPMSLRRPVLPPRRDARSMFSIDFSLVTASSRIEFIK